MTWLDRRHECGPPWDEIPADEDGWIGYWLCDLCGTQWRCTVGEYGGHSIGTDGTRRPTRAAQKVSNTRY